MFGNGKLTFTFPKAFGQRACIKCISIYAMHYAQLILQTTQYGLVLVSSVFEFLCRFSTKPKL